METPEPKRVISTPDFQSQDKEMRRLYEARQKALLDERSALGKAHREGREEGVREGESKVATKLLERGMTESEIVALTGLTESGVKELKSRLDNKE